MAFRVIARLDVKPPNLVKGIHMEGFRKIGDPGDFARLYYEQGAAEINYHDIVASLYERNSIGALVSSTAQSVFVPITVGGGVRSVADAAGLVRLGADKISINTAAIRDPNLIYGIARMLGSQTVVIGVEAKRKDTQYLAMTDCGREKTGRNVLDWVVEAQALGAGEILLTSIDREGTKSGFDLELIRQVRAVCSIPIIAHGGAGQPIDAVRAHDAGADGIAVASILHSGQYQVEDFKITLATAGIEVRT